MRQKGTTEESNRKFFLGIFTGIAFTSLLGIALYQLYRFTSSYNGADSILVQGNTSDLTLAVNAINNILTWGSFIVAVLTIAAAIFGILGVSAFREETKNSIKFNKNQLKSFSSKITSNTSIVKDTQKKQKDFISDINDLKYQFSQQKRFLERASENLFQTTELIAFQLQDESEAIKLLDFNNYCKNIILLYRAIMDDDDQETIIDIQDQKINAIDFLKINGSLEDIKHLEYVANHDLNEIIKSQAKYAIGYIQARINNSITSKQITR